MPKRNGTYYIVNASLFAKAVMPGIPASEKLAEAHKLNIEAPVVYDPQFIEPGETEGDFEGRVQTALEGGVVATFEGFAAHLGVPPDGCVH